MPKKNRKVSDGMRTIVFWRLGKQLFMAERYADIEKIIYAERREELQSELAGFFKEQQASIYDLTQV